MSTFDFLARYGAERFLPAVNDSVAAVHAWFNSALAQPGGKSSRITDTWMIVSARGVEMKQRFVTKEGVTFTDETPAIAFARHLQAWEGGPVAFFKFEKKPIDLKQVFLTYDPRVVRICTPRGAIGFDASSAPQPSADPLIKAIWKIRHQPPKPP